MSSHNHQPSTINQRSGIALVITLVLLSVITFMAVTFLVVSRHEGAQVDTITQQSNAKFAADAAAQQAMAQVIAQMQTPIGTAPNTYASGLNPFVRNGLNGSPFAPDYSGLLVSTNWIQPFYTNSKNITDVSYYADINNTPLTGTPYLAMLNNLLILPRAPVFVTTNRAFPYSDFRYWLDLNRNGVYDTNGLVAEADASGKPVNNFYVGDPEWIGVLNHPEQRHSPSNFFVARYAFIALPIGNSLDVNYIHNQGKQMAGSSIPNGPWSPGVWDPESYLRNQGVGSWELNLAGFLYELNRGYYDSTGTPYNYDTRPGNFSSIGRAFEDATEILQFRYGENRTSLRSFQNLTGNNPVALAGFTSDFIDGYCHGPLMTNVWYTNVTQDPDSSMTAFPWCGDYSTNQFFDTQDLFTKVPYYQGNPNNGLGSFSNFLYSIGRTPWVQANNSITNSYNRYTFYRMLSQMSFGSQTPEYPYQNAVIPALANNFNYMSAYATAPRMNLNYVNINGTNASSFIPWTPVQFFTNAADRMLRAYFPLPITNIINGVTSISYLSITNIPIYPNNFYSPAVQRVLQLAANMFDASTNKTLTLGFDCPSVFRPIFTNYQTAKAPLIAICGYKEVTNYLDVVVQSAPLDLRRPVDLGNFNRLRSPDVNIYGAPYIVGARPNLPSFYRFSMSPVVTMSRKLQITKVTPGAHPGPGSWFTNVQYTLGISNAYGLDCWYPSTNLYYGRSVTFYVTNDVSIYFTNNAVPNDYGIGHNIAINTNIGNWNVSISNSPSAWPGSPKLIATGPQYGLNTNSFKTPLFTNCVVLPDSVLQLNPRQLNATTNYIGLSIPFEVYNNGNGFLVPQWGLTITNRLRLMMVDTATGRLIDYVQLMGGQLETNLDLNADLSTVNTTLWNTNAANLGAKNFTPMGIVNQIFVGEGFNSSVGWTAIPLPPGMSVAQEISGFHTFMTGNDNTTNHEAPFLAYTKYQKTFTFTVNDPLVRFTVDDLTDLTQANGPNPILFAGGNSNALASVTHVISTNRYMPWGIYGTGNSLASIKGIEWAYKDPLQLGADFWQFSTNKYPNVGWLGRVHRGTPWQTVFLKPAGVSNTVWMAWTGDVRPGFYGGNDADFSQPYKDWLLMDLFTTAPNDNAEKGQLSINQTGVAAWSAALDGVITITNDTKGNVGTGIISPTDTNSVTGSNIVENLVYSINTNRATFPGGVFTSLGQICSVPQLTIGSSYLSAPTAASDAVVERIPQQIMSLLKVGTPRYVIFAYGQSLKPADHSIVTSGQYFGMCTNYQITGETVTRTVVRFENYPVPTPGQTTSTTHPRAVIESFNVLPPE